MEDCKLEVGKVYRGDESEVIRDGRVKKIS